MSLLARSEHFSYYLDTHVIDDGTNDCTCYYDINVESDVNATWLATIPDNYYEAVLKIYSPSLDTVYVDTSFKESGSDISFSLQREEWHTLWSGSFQVPKTSQEETIPLTIEFEFNAFLQDTNESMGVYRPDNIEMVTTYDEISIPALEERYIHYVNWDNEVYTDVAFAGASVIVEDPSIFSTTPTVSNYVFVGWATDNTTTTVDYEPGEEISLDNDMILYAVWELSISVVYGIFSDLPVTNMPPSEDYVFYNNESPVVHITDKIPSVEGYTFVGWLDSTHDMIFQPGELVSFGSEWDDLNLSLFAQFELSSTGETLSIKRNGTWVSGVSWIKNNNSWQRSKAIWIKSNGVWETK